LDILEIATLTLTALTACGALWAAWTTKKAAEGQLLNIFLTEYGSLQMRDDLRLLRNWEAEHGERFDEIWYKALHNRNDPLHATAERVDRARGHVWLDYFRKAVRLYEAKYVDRHFVEEVGRVHGINTMYHIVAPLGRALENGKWTDEPEFKKLQDICGTFGEGNLLAPVPLPDGTSALPSRVIGYAKKNRKSARRRHAKDR
jgi:hypothetical protein